MPDAQSTCWELIQGAAKGDSALREEFARRYEGVVRAYFGTRWRGSPMLEELDDAVQEVFLECLREGGVLERADPARGGFRGFFYGVARHVAQRSERRAAGGARPAETEELDLDALPRDEPTLSQAFDRAWALTLVREAADLQAARAEGPAQARRVELLRLRFEEGLPPREIARRWGVDPRAVHRQYDQAREEFVHALRDVVAAWCGADGSFREEMERIMELLG